MGTVVTAFLQQLLSLPPLGIVLVLGFWGMMRVVGERGWTEKTS